VFENVDFVQFPLSRCFDAPKFVSSMDLEALLKGEMLNLQFNYFGTSFLLLTDNFNTANLIGKIWNVKPSPQVGNIPRIVIKNQDGLCGRYIDCNNQIQLLSNTYTPFTLVKQALRREFALQCYESPYIPLHGVIVKWDNEYICFSGYGGAGKSFLADFILENYPNSRILIDDWCLLNVEDREISRLGDHYFHVRGSAMHRKSIQLRGALANLVELCDNSLYSEETRFLIERKSLPMFDVNEDNIKLDKIVFIRNPLSEKADITSDSREIELLLEFEKGHFWDDSNVSLPYKNSQDICQKWCLLLSKISVFIIDGHRITDLSDFVSYMRNVISPQ
jgi:hypothetical protein